MNQTIKATKGSSEAAFSAELIVTINGDTADELWNNLNWLLCNAVACKNELGGWPMMVCETNHGKIEVKQNSLI